MRLKRQDWIEEKNVNGYLAYAIGEIFLVVIGILIALQIDNWNRYRQERKEEAYILKSFLADLEKDVALLEYNIEQTRIRQKEIDALFILLQNPSEYNIEDFLKYQVSLTFDNYFTSNQGTFDESKASGKISYVLNNSLRERIFDYYRTVNNNWNNDQANYKTTNDLIIPILVDEIGTTSEMVKVFSGHNAEQLPSLDIASVAKNQRYYQALLYSTGERYQIRDWTHILDTAQGIVKDIKLELE